MNEHGYVRRIHKKLKARVKHDPLLLVWKVHDTYLGGVPDAFYEGEGGSLWVEYKYRKTAPVRSFDPKLSDLQWRFLHHRARAGRNAAAVIGSPKGAQIIPSSTFAANEEPIRIPPPDQWLSDEELIQWILDHCHLD